ncbi:hypothetical protein FB567DRAFT_119402 [Paraphoma chrysanthemicola]|uniref:Uncharacterized protein n=1 Tax=Paraphoma chrysanthemicola TaxID=798071 RepID=A0A8K0R308_9PLEO|nr:hypothetical protein FB567DRAFT_119402 [Paraphoma chrysanthemicola]
MHSFKAGQSNEQEKYDDVELGNSQVSVTAPRIESRLHIFTRRPGVFIPMVVAAVVFVALGVLGLVFLPSGHVLAGVTTNDQASSEFSPASTARVTLSDLGLPAKNITTMRRHKQHLRNSNFCDVNVMPKLNLTMPTNMTGHSLNCTMPFNPNKTLANEAVVEVANGTNANDKKRAVIMGAVCGAGGAIIVLFLLYTCRTCRH